MRNHGEGRRDSEALAIDRLFRSSVLFAAMTVAAAASATRFAAASTDALVIAGEEGVSESLLQTETLGRVVLHHPLYQIKQPQVVFTL